MKKMRLIKAFAIGMIGGMIISGVLSLFGVELGQLAGSIAFVAYMGAGWFIAPYVKIGKNV